MAYLRKRIPLLGLALFVLGASVVALTAQSPREELRPRPVAANPEAELPTPAELERRARALAQPAGELESGHQLIVPAAANPHR